MALGTFPLTGLVSGAHPSPRDLTGKCNTWESTRTFVEDDAPADCEAKNGCLLLETESLDKGELPCESHDHCYSIELIELEPSLKYTLQVYAVCTSELYSFSDEEKFHTQSEAFSWRFLALVALVVHLANMVISSICVWWKGDHFPLSKYVPAPFAMILSSYLCLLDAGPVSSLWPEKVSCRVLGLVIL